MKNYLRLAMVMASSLLVGSVIGAQSEQQFEYSSLDEIPYEIDANGDRYIPLYRPYCGMELPPRFLERFKGLNFRLKQNLECGPDDFYNSNAAIIMRGEDTTLDLDGNEVSCITTLSESSSRPTNLAGLIGVWLSGKNGTLIGNARAAGGDRDKKGTIRQCNIAVEAGSYLVLPDTVIADEAQGGNTIQGVYAEDCNACFRAVSDDNIFTDNYASAGKRALGNASSDAFLLGTGFYFGENLNPLTLRGNHFEKNHAENSQNGFISTNKFVYEPSPVEELVNFFHDNESNNNQTGYYISGIGNSLERNDAVFNEGDGFLITIPFGLEKIYGPILNAVIDDRAYFNGGHGFAAINAHGTLFRGNISRFNGRFNTEYFDMFDNNDDCAVTEAQMVDYNKYEDTRADDANLRCILR